jgi:VWFA-related protein
MAKTQSAAFRNAILISLCLIMVAEGGTQTVRQPEQRQDAEGFKFSVQSQLVEIYLTVTRGGRLVPNLQVSDFVLAEDGLPVPLDRLDNQDVPLEIVLLFDVSDSIRDSLNTTKDAAIAFVESLNTKDRVLLVLFNSAIRFFPQTTDDREPILREIRNAEARGMTKLYDALLFGLKYLEGKPGRKAVVCFTDGQDTSGSSSRTDVLNAAARAGYPIYTIGAGAGLEMASLQIILREFADINGGRAFFLQNLRKLREAFMEVAEELRSAYVLRYYTRVPSDGQWHTLDIRTRDPADSVHTRKGFFAASSAKTRCTVQRRGVKAKVF